MRAACIWFLTALLTLTSCTPGARGPGRWQGDTEQVIAGRAVAGHANDTSARKLSSPPPLSSHVMTYHAGLGMVVMFGGSDPDREPSNILWGWDGSRWHVLADDGPPPRLHAGLAYDSRRDRLVLYGGVQSRETSLGDTWEWDGTTWRLMAESPAGPGRIGEDGLEGPGIRDHHALVYDEARGVTLLFGGQDSRDEYPTQTWVWNGGRWSVAAEAGPPPRGTHRLVYDSHRKVVALVGGWGPDVQLGDHWEWNGETWTDVSRSGGPSPRGASRLAYHQGRRQLVLFGGLVGREHDNQTWVLRGNRWWRVDSDPPERNVHAMAYDVRRGRVVMYGGIGADGRMDDVWEWDGVRWDHMHGSAQQGSAHKGSAGKGSAGKPKPRPAGSSSSKTSGALDPIESKLVEYVDAHNAASVEFLERIVNMNSGTMNSEGVAEVGRVFRPRFEALGFDVEWIHGAAFERAGHLVARRAGKAASLHVLLIGHLDTVFEPDSPFQRYELQSGHIAKGPGIVDMKGGNLILVDALAALHHAGVLNDLTVTAILIGDEERPGQPIRLGREALVDAAKEADIAIAFENGDNDSETAVISRRGSTKWTLRVTATPAHSSQIFREDIGAGAVFEASRILHRFYDELAGEEYLTFNPGLVLGGTEIDYDDHESRGRAFGKANVIAESALVTGDLRSISPGQLQSAKDRMQRIVRDALPGTSAQIQFVDSYPPMAPTDGNRKLLALLDAASRDLGLGAMKPVDPNRAGAADVTFTAGHVDMAIDGLGLLGDDEHTLNEWADLRTLPMQTKRTAVLLYRLSR